MGNANARENGGGVRFGGGSGGGDGMQETNTIASNDGANSSRQPHALTVRVGSSDLAMDSPPRSPRLNSSHLVFNPQAPVVPLRGDGLSFFNQMTRNEILEATDRPALRGIPILITWSYGGNEVKVEGSWDNWASRKILHRSGKDHTVLVVLQSGVYRYRFIVDGQIRYIRELPFEADQLGRTCNLLDVQDFTTENCDGIREFEAPPSPDSSYGHSFLGDEDFAKEPVVVPPQLHQSVLEAQNSDEASSSSQKPQHVVLNHLFVEKGRSSQSVLALGLTHRFQQKYVTVVLYKPLQR